ncbi:uncharacterized protein CEXT_418031 [Caerostris extrusa]|uniref:Uncharacterized protein n=1 Tax=Caerostris extrusa TaxID=172846 RepID=A0AAV4VD47_CAEEX|nr:uncharacterized protein CEXT_418031 [Caerostris extrusa]
MCYTEDSDDLESVRRVTNDIRSAVEHGGIMYYKTNEASMDGLYLHEGERAVCKYMHSVRGQLFKRDQYKRWKMV